MVVQDVLDLDNSADVSDEEGSVDYSTFSEKIYSKLPTALKV